MGGVWVEGGGGGGGIEYSTLLKEGREEVTGKRVLVY